MRIATAGRVRLVAQALLVGAIAFALLRVASTWRSSHITLASIGWADFAAAFGAICVAVALASIVWTRILRLLGTPADTRWSSIWLQAQLAKYVPGSVWQYAGRVALAQSVGVPVRTSTLSVTIELGASIVAAGVLSLLVLGVSGAVLVVLIVVAILLASKFAWPRVAGATRAFAFGCCAYIPIIFLLGVALWALARALFPEEVGGLPLYCGAFAVAWLGGLVAVFAPGGIGVREAILVALLRHQLGTADAVVLAAASRLVLTLVDLLAAGVGAGMRRELQQA